MAGVGDEIGAHAREPVLLAQVAEGDEERRAARAWAGLGERGNGGEQASLDRHALVQLDGGGLPRDERLVDRGEQLGIAAHGGNVGCGVPSAPAGAEQVLCQAVGVDHVALVVENGGGLGNGVDHHAQHAVVARRRLPGRDRSPRGARSLVDGPKRGPRRDRDQADQGGASRKAAGEQKKEGKHQGDAELGAAYRQARRCLLQLRADAPPDLEPSLPDDVLHICIISRRRRSREALPSAIAR